MFKAKRLRNDTIVAVVAGNAMATNTGNAHTNGLKSDGTVVAVSDNNYSQCDARYDFCNESFTSFQSVLSRDTYLFTPPFINGVVVSL